MNRNIPNLIGKRVGTKNLTSTEWYRQCGWVVQWNEDRQRFAVKMERDGSIKLFKLSKIFYCPPQQNIQEGIQFIDDNNSPVPILDVMSQYTNNPEIEVLEVENLSQRNKPTQKRKSMCKNKFFLPPNPKTKNLIFFSFLKVFVRIFFLNLKN